jgi:hypothetical protein
MKFCTTLACAILAAAPAFFSPRAGAANLANGKTVFETYCPACHGNPPEGGPELAANNPSLIQSALQIVPAMEFMRPLLSANDINDVAAYLGVLLNGASFPADASFDGLWLKAQQGSGDSAEAGWGLNLVHQGTVLFATWFTYDLDGSGMWLVMSNGVQTSQGNFTGTLYRTVGPAFSSVPFTPIVFPLNYTTVGSLTLSFTDTSTGTMSYTVNGVSQSKPIQRYVYVPNPPTCALGATPGTTPNYQGLWLRSGVDEGGWGVNLVHQGDILFATWFTYDPTKGATAAGGASAKAGLWMVMSNGAKTGANTYSGTFYQTHGPAFNAVPFNSIVFPDNYTNMGTATFTFTDTSNGTFSYTINGVTQSKPIARFVFANPTTVCK